MAGNPQAPAPLATPAPRKLVKLNIRVSEWALAELEKRAREADRAVAYLARQIIEASLRP